jgi:hypothetical protein
MSTRSDINVQHPVSGQFASIYCHSDGYLENVGKMLFNHYNTLEKVVELIAMGGLTQLSSTPEDTVSYHKWRGEEIDIDISPLLSDHVNQKYSFLFKAGEWYVSADDGIWRLLSAALAEEETPLLTFENAPDEGFAGTKKVLDWIRR